MIGVFGGTGKIGGDVVKALHAKSAPFKCIVRDPDKAAGKLGGEVALTPGNFSDIGSLVTAFDGLDKFFFSLRIGSKYCPTRNQRDWGGETVWGILDR